MRWACVYSMHIFTESVLRCQFVFEEKKKSVTLDVAAVYFCLFIISRIKTGQYGGLGKSLLSQMVGGKALFSFTPWRPLTLLFFDWLNIRLDHSKHSAGSKKEIDLILLLPSGGGSLESLNTNEACSKTWLCNRAGAFPARTVTFIWGVYLKSNTDLVSS